MSERPPVALTIAGSDSGAGAGIQADLKTFAAIGVYGTCAITAVTAQNTLGVRDIHYAPAPSVAAQIDAVLEDFHVAAIKIGMLGAVEIIEAVAERLRLLEDRKKARPFVVYDPVMTASSGDPLSKEGFHSAIKAGLLPLIDCLTPNLAEAATLLAVAEARDEDAMATQGRALLALGPRAVLMKGGHLDAAAPVDILATPEATRRYRGPRIPSTNTHGAGCTLSAAIAAHVALGVALEHAVGAAKAFAAQAIEAGREVKLGGGRGPLMQMTLARRRGSFG